MQRSIEDYKKEIMDFYSRRTVDFTPPPAPENEQRESVVNETAETASAYPDGTGRLSVFVTHSGGLYPIANADVTVSDASGKIYAKQKTDISGKTPIINLPAPSKKYSEAPGPNISEVASFYNVRIDADGFVSAILEGLPIFDGILSNQGYDMTYLFAADNERPQVTRYTNQNTL